MSRIEQRHGLTCDTSLGLTEGMDPQKAAYERKQGLTEGKVSHMTDGRVFDTWEGLTEAGSHT